MLHRWLRGEQREVHSAVLGVHRMSTDATAEDDDLDEWLGRELLRNYVHPAERQVLVATLRSLGVDALADHLAESKLPGEGMVRTGEFGEALTGAVFRKLRRYCVPILKLRYKDRPGAAMQGPDLLAFRLSTVPPIVAVPEVKTQNDKRLGIGLKANDSLAGALDSLGAGIHFVGAQLLRQGNAVLGARVLGLLADDTKVIERHVVVVHEDSAWDDRIIDRLGAVVSETTEATIIRVRQLRERIATTYTAAARALDPSGQPAAAEPQAAPGA